MKLIPCPLRANAVKIGRQPAIISGSLLLDYEEFDRVVDFSVKKLLSIGVKPDYRVCIVSPVNIEYLAVLIALWRIGAVACLLNSRNPRSVINEQCKNVRPKIILRKGQLQHIVNLKYAITSKIQKCPVYAYPFQQAATVIFSSGSGIAPKAIQQAIGNHYYNAKGANENIPLQPGDRWVVSLPLYHVSGLSILFRCLLGAAAVVIPDKNEDIRTAVVKYKPTHISFVAAQLYRLLADKKPLEAFKKLKAILLGGSAIAKPLLKQAVGLGLPVYISYGLTEMCSQVAATGLLKGNRLFLKQKILRYRRVRIASDGEILLSGKTLFQGYVKDGLLIRAVDRNGWFHSADLGYIENGKYLFVKGRKDAMFISGGENIFPEEIEQILYNSEFIEQAVVIPLSSDEYGYRPIAFIKPKKNKQLSRQILFKYLSRHLPKFKIPDNFYLWPDELESAGIKLPRREFIRFLRQGTPKIL